MAEPLKHMALGYLNQQKSELPPQQYRPHPDDITPPTSWLKRQWAKTWRLRRQWKWFWQRRTRGFDDTEIWDLDTTISRFALPRIKVLVQNLEGYPPDLTKESWELTLLDIIYAMEVNIAESEHGPQQFADWDRVQSGFEAFGKYYRNLWD